LGRIGSATVGGTREGAIAPAMQFWPLFQIARIRWVF